ncbi:MAG: hydroxyacid dehydrogenase [Oscillospiraceae bacterium]|nr:hydroxyacid dehydrogenase [Oscillospiraceae bacterium]
MQKITVLMSERTRERVFLDEHYEFLRALGNLHIYDRSDFSDMEYVYDFVEGTDILISGWGTPKIDAEMLVRCPSLKGVVYAGGTIKKRITQEFIDSGIPISDSKCVDSKAVGVTTLGLAIAACKGAFFLPDELRNGLWRENYHKVVDFCGLKIGIVGAGVAGREFIRLLQNFDVEILVYDPTLSAEEIKEQFNARKCELTELMSASDVISLHAPTLPSTKEMINKDNLTLIKDGAVFINTARAWLVDEAALIEECKKGRFTAILDVTNVEPVEADSPLRTLRNVVLLPHIAGTTNNGVKFIGKHVCEETERLIKGEPMKCKVDLSKLSVLA